MHGAYNLKIWLAAQNQPKVSQKITAYYSLILDINKEHITI